MPNLKFDISQRASESPFIESIWQTQTIGGASFLSPAMSYWEIVITRQRGKATLSIRGPETKATMVAVPAEPMEFLGILLKREVFLPNFLKSSLVKNALHIPESSKNSFWHQGGIWDFPSFENADTFIDQWIRSELLVKDPIVGHVLCGKTLNFSLRSIQRRFMHVTGLTIKSIQQIDKAQKAVILLKSGMSILDVIYHVGYFDQSHLTRSLILFAGQTPANIIRLNSVA